MAITIDGTNGLSSDNAALKLDGTTLAVDETNNRVGVGTASPAVAMDVVGQVRASTGILFGTDTAAANALDDYEEGTWTPTLTAGSSNPTVSYSRQQGKYVKVGQLVYVSLNILTSSISGGSGMLRVSGLPFTSSTGTEADRASAIFGYVSGFSATTTPTVGLLISNGTYIDLYTTGSADARDNKTISVNSPPATNINLYMTLVYRADS